MLVKQLSLTEENWKESLTKIDFDANLFLLFVSPYFNFKKEILESLKKKFPKATLIGCSTAGEISGITVKDKSISLTVIQFKKVPIKKVSTPVVNLEGSYTSGERIGEALYSEDLKHVLVFSDGLHVNGADLVDGLKSKLPKVSITGGMAADGNHFDKTFVVNDGNMVEKTVVGLGFYGNHLNVGCGSKGGWDSFGVARLVTKSEKNVLYELDDLPALTVLEQYKKPFVTANSISHLLYPLSVRLNENVTPVIRTIFEANQENKSLICKGNIPEGSTVRIMKYNTDRLIIGAENAALNANKNKNGEAQLAILISCAGRRNVLKQLVEEEVEAVRAAIGEKPMITGFYSYGEIAPFDDFSPCELHNQTMTITILSEC